MDRISQVLIKSPDVASILRVTYCKSEEELSTSIISSLPSKSKKRVYLGVAILLTPTTGLLEAIAFATPADEIFVFKVTRRWKLSNILDVLSSSPRASALSDILLSRNAVLTGLPMARIIMHIRNGLKLHVRGLDLAELMLGMGETSSPGALVAKLWPESEVDTFAIDTIWDAVPSDSISESRSFDLLCLRAWVTTKIAMRASSSRKIDFLDTSVVDDACFDLFQRMLIEVEILEAATPREVEGEFYDQSILVGNAGVTIIIDNERYKTHLRRDGRTEVRLVDLLGNVHRGRVTKVVGKKTHIILLDPKSYKGASFTSIYVVGKPELTYDEEARESFLLQLLQDNTKMNDVNMHLIRAFFFNDQEDLCKEYKAERSLNVSLTLNQSQARVVEAMVHSPNPFIIVQGPPGTGKTFTISAAARKWASLGKSTWIIAQANVGVKNIAERLSKDKIQYRILVSKEFFHEWNESIYSNEVKSRIIFTNDLSGKANCFIGIKVILCTKCTLFNDTLDELGIFKSVPVNNLVIDEVSQIALFDYAPLLAKLTKLSKLCCFGDPNQLPPHRKDLAPRIQNIFDLLHFKDQVLFLDTQYRLPTPLGNFISQEVYQGALSSEHEIKSPLCVAFVDVPKGEEQKVNTSYRNLEEVKVVTFILRNYYMGKNVCVITPYDAQRSVIQDALKRNGILSVNVYNIDSYQGNEADYIVLSVVRTTSPGFLESMNRSNVMLTRCRKGMVIVTNEFFIRRSSVQHTLLGNLCSHWEREYGQGLTWRSCKEVMEKTVKLPGYDNDAEIKHNIIGKAGLFSQPSSIKNLEPNRSSSTCQHSDEKLDTAYLPSLVPTRHLQSSSFQKSHNVSIPIPSSGTRPRGKQFPKVSDAGMGIMMRGSMPVGGTTWKTVSSSSTRAPPLPTNPVFSRNRMFATGPGFGFTSGGIALTSRGLVNMAPKRRIKLKQIRDLAPTARALQRSQLKPREKLSKLT